MIFYLVPHFPVLGDSRMAKYRHQVYVSNIEIIFSTAGALVVVTV